MLCALTKDAGVTLDRIEERPALPDDPQADTKTGWHWLALTIVKPTLGEDERWGDPVVSVDLGARSATKTWPVIPLTDDEIDAKLEPGVTIRALLNIINAERPDPADHIRVGDIIREARGLTGRPERGAP